MAQDGQLRREAFATADALRDQWRHDQPIGDEMRRLLAMAYVKGYGDGAKELARKTLEGLRS